MDVTKLWERFFTAQDKAHDEVWGKKQPRGSAQIRRSF